MQLTAPTEVRIQITANDQFNDSESKTFLFIVTPGSKKPISHE